MSSDEKKVSLQDIQVVQNLIERCLQLYMTKREAMNTLFQQAKIEPAFTQLVWQKLEAENQEFFRAYYTRLILKDQILRFNRLLEKQVELMHFVSQSGVPLTPLPNGSQMQSMERDSSHRDPQPHGPSIKSENMPPVFGAVPNDYTIRTYPPQQHMEVAAHMPVHAERMNFPAHMALLENSNAGTMQGFNGITIKTEGLFAGNSPVMFHNVLDAHNAAREVSISSLNGGESCSQSFSESLLEMEKEMSSFGVEHEITPNFGLSADFSTSTDIMESYSGTGSPFMATESSLLEYKQEFRRLEDGFSYEGFGSN